MAKVQKIYRKKLKQNLKRLKALPNAKQIKRGIREKIESKLAERQAYMRHFQYF